MPQLTPVSTPPVSDDEIVDILVTGEEVDEEDTTPIVPATVDALSDDEEGLFDDEDVDTKTTQALEEAVHVKSLPSDMSDDMVSLIKHYNQQVEVVEQGNIRLIKGGVIVFKLVTQEDDVAVTLATREPVVISDELNQPVKKVSETTYSVTLTDAGDS